MRYRTSICIRTLASTVAMALGFAVAIGLPTGSAYGAVQNRHTHHAVTKHSVKHTAHTYSSKSGASLHHVSYSHGRHRVVSRHHRNVIVGQRVMEPQRATEIQQALIQAHYLDGAATGQWDAATQAAMEKYQTDNGWQSKITPDSRALIKLGLGPKQDEGEYANTPSSPASVSSLSGGASSDTLRSMAASELPTTEN